MRREIFTRESLLFNRKWEEANLECFSPPSLPFNIAFIKKHYYWQAWWKRQSLKLLTSKHFPLFNLFVNQKLSCSDGTKGRTTQKIWSLVHGWFQNFVVCFRDLKKQSVKLLIYYQVVLRTSHSQVNLI